MRSVIYITINDVNIDVFHRYLFLYTPTTYFVVTILPKYAKKGGYYSYIFLR